ncbi:DUF2752 domain-containing protein [Streptomyces sp. BI20]|uniref:DUF2752 domain-containing protein n=1 Tax=Streptomyces sp. BI20 TaxID=3403460 RepID=UPI003C709226
MDPSRTPPTPPAGPWHPRPAAVAPAPRGPARRLLPPAALLTGIVAAFGYVAAVDPNEPGHYPACPLLRYTGLYCPGCGGLRSAHAFAHGDLPTALGANAPAVLGYLFVAGFLALWFARAARGRPVPRVVLSTRGAWILGGSLVLFSIVRNLPIGGFLAP